MASGESFDPRTWKGGESAPAATPAITPEPAAVVPPAQAVVVPVAGARFGWWLGPVLSAAILAGGALAAYQTRGETPAVAAASSAQ